MCSEKIGGKVTAAGKVSGASRTAARAERKQRGQDIVKE
jgi:hypothetical protein